MALVRGATAGAVVAVLAALLAAPGPAAAATSEPALRPVRGPIVRRFEAPGTPYGPGHRGVDLAVPVGTPVVAARAGVVAFAGQVGRDLFVSVDHPDGLRTTYSFLAAVWVRKGQAVARGQVLGASGPGHPGATEPHLHFGVRFGEAYLDPEPILLDGLRRDLAQAIRLVAADDAAAGATR
jgi:murein DD-endopeptidase MepM/ murein hydrolase activator NlpD